MRMLWISAGLALALGLAGVAPSAAQVNEDGKRYDKGATVTIQGCVVAGEKPDTFVLTGIQEWPIGNSPTGKFGPRSYWLDKGAEEIKHHVGQTIQLVGVVAGVRESEVEREPGGWHGGTRVAIELPGQDVITSPANAGVPGARMMSREDMKITLLKFHVDDLLVVMNGCLPR